MITGKELAPHHEVYSSSGLPFRVPGYKPIMAKNGKHLILLNSMLSVLPLYECLSSIQQQGIAMSETPARMGMRKTG